MSVPEEIRREMGAQKLTQSSLAELTGLGRSTIKRKIINEERKLNLDELEALAEVLRVPASELFARAEQRAEQEKE